MLFTLLIAILASLHPVASLKISSALLWVEWTPQRWAAEKFYKGSSPVTFQSGGVAFLGNDSSFDLAANAETQGLIQYANHRNIRLIYVICNVPYRIVARKSAGIKTLADLKGKRIGTFRGTSAGVFVHNMMSSVGVKDNEYTVVSGNVCMRAPCGSNTFPAMLKDKKVDAIGVWESTVELGAQAIGNDAIIFQDESVYREVYSFYSTTEKLNNPAKRKDILEFVRALNKTLDVYKNDPESVYPTVAKWIDMDVPTLKAVWEDHKWDGTPWTPELLEYLVKEDQYLAAQDKRPVTPRAELQKFLDTSIMEEL